MNPLSPFSASCPNGCFPRESVILSSSFYDPRKGSARDLIEMLRGKERTLVNFMVHFPKFVAKKEGKSGEAMKIQTTVVNLFVFDS